jgi:hypothetical protein
MVDVAEILHDEFFGLAAALGFYLLEGHSVSFGDKGTKNSYFSEMIIVFHVVGQIGAWLDAHGIYPKFRLLLRFYLWEGTFKSLQTLFLYILTLGCIL